MQPSQRVLSPPPDRKPKYRPGVVRAIRIYTKEETDAHQATVEQLLLSLASPLHIVQLCRVQHGIGPARVKTLTARIRARWSLEDEERRPTMKAEAVRRLSRWIVLASGQQAANGTWIVPANHAALVRYEALLADIQGTREPIKVDIDIRVSRACVNVIAGLSAEQVQQYLAKYQENVRLAEAYRAQLAPKP